MKDICQIIIFYIIYFTLLLFVPWIIIWLGTLISNEFWSNLVIGLGCAFGLLVLILPAYLASEIDDPYSRRNKKKNNVKNY